MEGLMKTRKHKTHIEPTETQKKFFDRNKLVLPPKAAIAEDIIRFIKEEDGERYLQRIELVRSLQVTLIGTELDTGETVEYITCTPLHRRKSEYSSILLAGIRKGKGSLFQRRFEFCRKDGCPLFEQKERNPGVDWDRYSLFRSHLCEEIVKLSRELLETDPKWKFDMAGSEFSFWIDPKKVSGKRATGKKVGLIRYAVMNDEEANQVGELLARIPLPNGVSIRRQFMEPGVCGYQIHINPDLFKKDPI